MIYEKSPVAGEEFSPRSSLSVYPVLTPPSFSLRTSWIFAFFLSLLAISAPIQSTASPNLVDWLKSELSVQWFVERYQITDSNSLPTLKNSAITLSENYERRDVTLSSLAGPIELAIQKPRGIEGPLPVIFFATGFQTGKNVIDLIPDSGRNILVGYSYPLPTSGLSPNQAGEIAAAMEKTVVQLALAWKWILAQNWCDNQRLTVTGVSLGTLFLPAAMRVAERAGVPLTRTIFAFGAADFGLILKYELDTAPESSQLTNPQKNQLIEFCRALTLPLDPATHLRFLHGHFLVIEGEHDEVFPPDAQAALRDKLPEPKTVVRLPAPHINSDKQFVIMQTAQAMIEWLLDEKAINP